MRPTKTQTNMTLAYVVAARSHDPDTRHGAIVVNAREHVIGTGYNGFPKGAPDSAWPDTRPDKYPRIVHAEPNALVNCEGPTAGSTLYVTGLPCPQCMGLIVNAGIVAVVFGMTESAMVDEAATEISVQIARECGVKLLRYEEPADLMLAMVGQRVGMRG